MLLTSVSSDVLLNPVRVRVPRRLGFPLFGVVYVCAILISLVMRKLCCNWGITVVWVGTSLKCNGCVLFRLTSTLCMGIYVFMIL